jgi:hypothetical protein
LVSLYDADALGPLPSKRVDPFTDRPLTLPATFERHLAERHITPLRQHNNI